MKARFLPALIMAVALMAGCDRIELSEAGGYVIYGGSTAEWTAGTPVAQPVQRAYVEKYTGPTCTNCPLADVTLDAAHEQFGESLVVVAINHPTGMGVPFPGQPDMRTEEGTAWDNYFGINTIPAAFLNRNTETQYQGAMNDIADDIQGELAKSPVVALEGACEVTGEGHDQASITVNLQFMEAYSSPVTLTLVLTEDSLVYWQLIPNGTKKDDYVHNHMLRDVITDLWGADIDCTGAAGEARKATFSYTAQQSMQRCHVVAFVSNKASRKVLNSVQLETRIR